MMENLEPIACFHDTIDHFETNRCRSDSPGFVLGLKESLRQSAYDFRALGNLKLPKRAALGKSCIPPFPICSVHYFRTVPLGLFRDPSPCCPPVFLVFNGFPQKAKSVTTSELVQPISTPQQHLSILWPIVPDAVGVLRVPHPSSAPRRTLTRSRQSLSMATLEAPVPRTWGRMLAARKLAAATVSNPLRPRSSHLLPVARAAVAVERRCRKKKSRPLICP